MRSAGGEPFDAFAKATTPGRALYLWEDTVAPFYATGAVLVHVGMHTLAL